MAGNDTVFSYDLVPYSSKPFPQTHPDRLATVATLFSLQPTPVDRCRVLELGCGRGGNLLPMADRLPNSEFVGVDLSQVQIDEAVRRADHLNLRNVSFRHANILELGDEIGCFDYIIVHGVYSWVPPSVQDKILSICKDHLGANGVAYISYNTYPGWNMRTMVRDMVCYHAGKFSEPRDKIDQARELLSFFAKHAPGNTPFGAFLKSEVEVLRRHEDAYLFHEHLEDVNDPVYFYEFAQRAEAKGLQYLGESEIGAMYNGHLPTEVIDTLDRVANSLVQMEQYIDFLKNRMFRQTLLCHADLAPDRNLGLSDLMKLWISSGLRPNNLKGTSGSTNGIEFHGGGVKVAINHPLLQSCLIELGRIYPMRLPFVELARRARLRSDPRPLVTTEELESQYQNMARELLTLFVSGAIELHTTDGGFQPSDAPRPHASALCREQALCGEFVTSGQHIAVTVDGLERRLLCLLDGTRTIAQLESIVRQWVQSGEIQLQADTGKSPADTLVSKAFIETIQRLGRLGLLSQPPQGNR